MLKRILPKFGVALALFAVSAFPTLASADIVLIDFGLNGQTTSGNWNNSAGATAAKPNNISNLINSTGGLTGIGFTYTEQMLPIR